MIGCLYVIEHLINEFNVNEFNRVILSGECYNDTLIQILKCDLNEKENN
jgi:hypothetical protein